MLPIEICRQIISTLWSSPISPSERATFIKSSLLVSRTWNTIFTRVSAHDVHILSSPHGLQFIDLLLGNAGTCRLQMLDQLCHSITVQHSNQFLLPGPANEKEQPLGLVVHAILNIIFMSSERLPSLRRISFNLGNYLMETFFTRNRFLYLAPQLDELEFNFSYSNDTDPLVIQAIKSRSYESFDIPRYSMVHIRKLRILGTSSGVAKELLGACGGRTNLDVFEQDAWREDSAIQTSRTISKVSSPRIVSPPSPAYTVEHETVTFDSDTETAEDVTQCSEVDWPPHKQIVPNSNTFSKRILRPLLRVFHRRKQVRA